MKYQALADSIKSFEERKPAWVSLQHLRYNLQWRSEVVSHRLHWVIHTGTVVWNCPLVACGNPTRRVVILGKSQPAKNRNLSLLISSLRRILKKIFACCSLQDRARLFREIGAQKLTGQEINNMEKDGTIGMLHGSRGCKYIWCQEIDGWSVEQLQPGEWSPNSF